MREERRFEENVALLERLIGCGEPAGKSPPIVGGEYRDYGLKWLFGKSMFVQFIYLLGNQCTLQMLDISARVGVMSIVVNQYL